MKTSTWLAAATLLAYGAAAAAQAPAAQPSAAADPKRGQRLWLQCRACHALQDPEPGKIGPALGGVFGARAGARPDFDFSKALGQADFVWDEATMDRWIEAPSRLVPGTTMVFAGIANPQQRRDLIAFMKDATRPAAAGAGATPKPQPAPAPGGAARAQPSPGTAPSPATVPTATQSSGR